MLVDRRLRAKNSVIFTGAKRPVGRGRRPRPTGCSARIIRHVEICPSVPVWLYVYIYMCVPQRIQSLAGPIRLKLGILIEDISISRRFFGELDILIISGDIDDFMIFPIVKECKTLNAGVLGLARQIELKFYVDISMNMFYQKTFGEIWISILSAFVTKSVFLKYWESSIFSRITTMGNHKDLKSLHIVVLMYFFRIRCTKDQSSDFRLLFETQWFLLRNSFIKAYDRVPIYISGQNGVPFCRY